MTTALTSIASAAVRIVNKENGISLKKVAGFGDALRGAVVYKDAEWCEYRVMFFENALHLKEADYHTASILPQDKADAINTAEYFVLRRESADPTVKMEQETASAIAAVEEMAERAPDPTPDEPTVTTTVRRNRPRGYYAKPSGLLRGLLSQV